MKYLTTLEAAHDLKVSKQTLLNWLYAGKIPEPPRNLKGYRLWSESRVALVKKVIAQGRLHSRTVVHRQPSNQPEFVAEYAREVTEFLRDGAIDMAVFLRALARAGSSRTARAPRRRMARAGAATATARAARRPAPRRPRRG
jgi:predicted site-specific integrase-resolvase